MIKEKSTSTENHQCCQDVLKKGKHHHSHCNCHHSSTIYSLGVIGALFYFLQNAATFTTVMVGIFKAVFWPAFIIFRILTDLKI